MEVVKMVSHREEHPRSASSQGLAPVEESKLVHFSIKKRPTVGQTNHIVVIIIITYDSLFEVYTEHTMMMMT